MKITLLIIVLFTIFPVTAFSQHPQLTIQEATNRAVSNSNLIRNYQDNIAVTREQEQRARDALWMNQNSTYGDFINFQTQMLRNSADRARNLDNIAAQRETLRFTVTSHFFNITRAKNELVNSNKSLEIQANELQAMRTRESLGMASRAQLDAIQNAYTRALHTRANLENSINTAFRELNRLMGTNINNTYELVFSAPFMPIGDINIADYIRLHQNNDVQIENAQRNLNIARFERDVHNQITDPSTGAIVPGGITRTQRELTLTQATRELNNVRDRVQNSVVDLYNNILNEENTINSTQLQLYLRMQELEVLQVEYNMGQRTEIYLDRKELEILNLQETLRRHKANHYLFVMRLTNPNIVHQS